MGGFRNENQLESKDIESAFSWARELGSPRRELLNIEIPREAQMRWKGKIVLGKYLNFYSRMTMLSSPT